MRRVAKDVKGIAFGPGDSFFDAKLSAFQNQPSLSTATELVVASVVCGAEAAGREAAEYIRQSSTPISDSIDAFVNRSIDSTALLSSFGGDSVNFLSSTGNLRSSIHDLRQKTHETPRNSFLWVNLARAYLVVGEFDKARHCLGVALKLAPENRYVLRCASRFLIHLDQPIDAARLLQGRSTTRHDPWLMAAEIAAAEIAGVGSRTAQIAKKILKDPDDPTNLTELAGSFATLQLYAGNVKGATKNFRFSLVEPTENSVAQAEWASSQIPGITPSDTQLGIARGYEARAANAYKAGEMDQALDCLAQWGSDEPYSTRPFITGSYLTCIATHDFDRARRFCEAGLQANSDDSTLLNNYAVALAMFGRVEDAKTAYSRAINTKGEELPKHIQLATAGLLLFRDREPDSGRVKYLDSISKAPEWYKPLLALHLAQEELYAETEHQKEAWELVHSHARPKDRPEVALFVKNLGHDLTEWK